VEQLPPPEEYIKCPRCGTTFPSTIRDVTDPRAWPETVSLRLDTGTSRPASVARLSQTQVQPLEVVREPAPVRPSAKPERSRRSVLATVVVLGTILALVGLIAVGGYQAYETWLGPHAGEPDVVLPTKTLEARPGLDPAGDQQAREDSARDPAGAAVPEEKEERRPPVFADGTPWVGLGKGNRVLEIDGVDLDGQPLRLSEFHGKVILLDFWADWCVYCRRMYPFERDLVKKLENRPFVLVGVNCDESKTRAKRVVQNEQLNWRSFWDGRPTGMPICSQWNISAYPRLFVIDHKGVIREQIEGMPRDEEALGQRIEALVAEAEKDAGTAAPTEPPGRKLKDVTKPNSPPPGQDKPPQ
jgi:thiol-disulfide isomerase/thioredoxin